MQRTFCPYRICPLGAHTDHQYGCVTGFAIDKGIYITYRPTKGITCLSSKNFPGVSYFGFSSISDRQKDWGDYIRGATIVLQKKHPLTYGIEGTIEGELPVGGLSSSAAVCIAYLSALAEVNEIYLPAETLIDYALNTENDYVGVNCGKLDQSCEVYSRANHLLFLDIRENSYVLMPQHVNMRPYEIAIFFSGLERSLGGTAYNMRVDELKSSAYALMAYAGMKYGSFSDARLRDVPRAVFDEYKDRLPENWRRRATHYYTEQERVQKGVEAWRSGDILKFGQYIFESGYSSIFTYETGSPQLKRLYEIMTDTTGIYGGRFSGAGFKGCCMAMIDPLYRDSIKDKVTEGYLRTFPEMEGKFSVHFCKTADGVAYQNVAFTATSSHLKEVTL